MVLSIVIIFVTDPTWYFWWSRKLLLYIYYIVKFKWRFFRVVVGRMLSTQRWLKLWNVTMKTSDISAKPTMLCIESIQNVFNSLYGTTELMSTAWQIHDFLFPCGLVLDMSTNQRLLPGVANLIPILYHAEKNNKVMNWLYNVIKNV